LPSKYLKPVTDAEALPGFALVAEQLKTKELLPPTSIVTDSVPEVALDPDQAPDAEQLEARLEDQVKVMAELTSTESAEVERVTVILDKVGAGSADPPPPPPHPNKKINATSK
jgi:hypothetical protein